MMPCKLSTIGCDEPAEAVFTVQFPNGELLSMYLCRAHGGVEAEIILSTPGAFRSWLAASATKGESWLDYRETDI